MINTRYGARTAEQNAAIKGASKGGEGHAVRLSTADSDAGAGRNARQPRAGEGLGMRICNGGGLPECGVTSPSGD
jgi:hypothetical protein